VNRDFVVWCREVQELPHPYSRIRDRLTALHNAMLAHIAELEAENERLRADVTALLTGDFSQWGKVPE